MKYLILILVILIINDTLLSQDSILYVPLNVQQAYTNNTRSYDGFPGPEYWQNHADYNIRINFEPKSGFLSGTEEIKYFNDSPDELWELVIHLFPNIYKKGNSREFDIDSTDASRGVTLTEIQINDLPVEINDTDRWIEYIHNDIKVHLEEPLHSKDSLSIKISWNYKLNRKSHMRTGLVDSSSYFVAYFFPRIAVYDDISGWNYFKYSGIAEFYNDFGSFDVSVTVPDNYIVWGTGTLQNAQEVLTDKYYRRYSAAHTTDSIIQIIDSTEYLSDNITTSSGSNTWRFMANTVNDFAFALSDHYLWDATSLLVDDESGRRVFIDAAYNKDSKDFYEVATIAHQSIDYMSKIFPGIPFPFPALTVFNGLDEMEYPMMVNDKSVSDRSYLIKLTSHEISHSYFPFYMGINETKYGWMDEGLACFIEYHICEHLDSKENANIYYMSRYNNLQGNEADLPMISPSIFLKRPIYHINTYAKPATFLFILGNQLGDHLFNQAIQEYMRRWNGKHPTPYDFFFTINDFCNKNLNWLFRPWFFEFGYVDLAVKSVTKSDQGYQIIIEKIGRYPAPIELKITFDDQRFQSISESVSVWSDGRKNHIITLPFSKTIHSVELSDPVIPDADLSNNFFEIE
jgi:hypothetical protein